MLTEDGKHLYVSYDEYHNLIEKLAIKVHQSGWQFDTILCLARGGMRPGDVLSRIFDKPLAIMSTSSYRADAGTVQGHLDIARFITTPKGEIAGKVLLVDDLAGFGPHAACRGGHAAQSNYKPITELRSAVLWTKALSTFTPDYSVEFLQTNPWIHQPFEGYDSHRRREAAGEVVGLSAIRPRRRCSASRHVRPHHRPRSTTPINRWRSDSPPPPQPGSSRPRAVFFNADVASHAGAQTGKTKAGSTPTRSARRACAHLTLEERLATLEAGTDCLLMPSGLAAISLVAFAAAQDRWRGADPRQRLWPQQGAGQPANWPNFGVKLPASTRRWRRNDLAAKLSDRTQLVWLEAAGSVTMEFPDLPALVGAVREHGVVRRSTTPGAPGLYFTPFDLDGSGQGVDISVHALTRYPSGGGDVLMGSVITREPRLHQSAQAHAHAHGLGRGRRRCGDAAARAAEHRVAL